MPSKKKKIPGIYSTTDIAKAAGLSARNVAFLCEQEPPLLPIVGGGGSPGSHRQFDSNGLYTAAVIGAAHQAGVPLIAAARVVDCIFNDQLFPIGLTGPHEDDTFVRFSQAFEVLPNDLVIVVHDSEYVFTSRAREYTSEDELDGLVEGNCQKFHYPELVAFGSIIGWGTENVMHTREQEVEKIFDGVNLDQEKTKEFRKRWRNARQPLGTLQINATMAMRRAEYAVSISRTAAVLDRHLRKIKEETGLS